MSQSSLSLGKMDLKLNEELNNECMVNVLNNKPLNPNLHVKNRNVKIINLNLTGKSF